MEELLSPYRVLDLTNEKGMLCGKTLADMGADVIKIEPPLGDTARKMGPFYKDIPDPKKCLLWFYFNANKRGITLNLEMEDGKEIFREIVRRTDILVESFDPGHLEGLGLGYDELCKFNPQLVMTSITPFGQQGPKAQYRSSELTQWASGAAMYIAGDPDRPPVWMTLPQACLHAGTEAAFACLVALYHRERTGEGQHVDLSIQECVIGTLMDTPEIWHFTKKDIQRQSFGQRLSGRDVFQRFGLPCKDGFVTIYLLGGGFLPSAEHLDKLRNWMDEEGMAPDWFKNIDWVKDYDSAVLNQELVDKVESTIEAFLGSKTKDELYKRAIKDGLILAPICDAQDVWENEQLRARNFWMEMNDKQLGARIPYSGRFAILSETPLKEKRLPPMVGEHNEEIYMKELGLSRERLLFLMEIGAI